MSKLQTALALKRKKNRWLELIAVYKLLQAAFLISVGLGALRLLHKDVADVLGRVVKGLRMNPEGHAIAFLLDKAALVDDHRLRQFSVFMFCYAALGLLEGLGLLFEKVWAEYLTAIITASFLPFEIFEIHHKVTNFKIALFAVNLAVLIYLVGHLVRHKGGIGKNSGLS